MIEMITYNYDLFLTLLVLFYFINGVSWAWCSIVNNGEVRTWKWYGALDGLFMMVMCIVPMFFYSPPLFLYYWFPITKHE